MGQEKKVVDQVSGWLTVYDDGTVDRSWTGPPEAKFMTDAVPPHADYVDGVATADVDACDGLRLRLYLPEHPRGKLLPVLLHFHGGGFCISSADWFMYYATYTALARAAGAVVVSVYLRLAPEHRLPAACDDGYAALLWLRSVAEGESREPRLEGRADFRRVFLIGDSSGGNVVHQVALRAAKGVAELAPVRVAGAIPVHPGFCRAERSRSEVEQPQTPFLTLDMVDKFLALALPAGATKDHPITCPMGKLAAAAAALPPYLYCVAEQDLMTDTEMEFYEEMKAAGKKVELVMSAGVGHSFYLNRIAVTMDANTAEETEKLFRRIAEFVHSH